MDIKKPKVNLAANIVNNLFLDSDYQGKDWEAVRKKLIKKIEQALKEVQKETIKAMLVEEREVKPPTLEEDMEYHWNTGNHLSKCSYCGKGVSDYENKFTECYCSNWNDDGDNITWKSWKKGYPQPSEFNQCCAEQREKAKKITNK